jgi:hypothetical protein
MGGVLERRAILMSARLGTVSKERRQRRNKCITVICDLKATTNGKTLGKRQQMRGTAILGPRHEQVFL